MAAALASIPVGEFRINSGTLCATPDPLRLVREEHALQLELCDLLEAIADGLPAVFDRALATVAIAILPSSVPSHMRFEDGALFPLLRRRAESDERILAALDCLEAEHDRDEGTLIELLDALKTAIAAEAVKNPEMLGYLLRGFFESQRRHIAWEERVVMPAAHAALSPEDLAELQDWIMRSDHPRCSRQPLAAIRKARSARTLCVGCAEVQRTTIDNMTA